MPKKPQPHWRHDWTPSIVGGLIIAAATFLLAHMTGLWPAALMLLLIPVYLAVAYFDLLKSQKITISLAPVLIFGVSLALLTFAAWRFVAGAGAASTKADRGGASAKFKLSKADVTLQRDTARCEPTKITPESIWKDFDSYARSAYFDDPIGYSGDESWMASRYRHECVEWTLPLVSPVVTGDDVIELTLADPTWHGALVGVQVRAEDFPSLRREWHPSNVTVRGKIEGVTPTRIFLRDAVVTGIPSSTPTASLPGPVSSSLTLPPLPGRADIKVCSDPSPLSPDDIWNDGRQRTAYERDTGAAYAKFENVCVTWTLPLRSLEAENRTSPEALILFFKAGISGLLTIATAVRSDEYPQLKLLKEDALVTVTGRIWQARTGVIFVGDSILEVAPPGRDATPPKMPTK
jgi:hypothetical protein